MTATLPVCIIGAGSSGLTTAKALQQRGVAFECLEMGSDLGGMWRYENDNGVSSAYRSLHIDTSRDNLGYSDFPISRSYPDFLSHYQVIEYFEAYAQHFDLRRHIQFNTKVVSVEPEAENGTWRVQLHSGEVRRYRAVIVANGHLWDPRWPDFPGTFTGRAIHSHHYRTADAFAGKNVLIVGIGNSAVDIAVDVCKQARSTLLSTRRSAWIMPKYILGRPTDKWSGFLAKKLGLPTQWTRMVMRYLMMLSQGDQRRFGIPQPAHPMWREHATLSQELLPYVGHGWIGIKPNIEKLCGDAVQFADGSSAPVDAIIYATGYRTSFPFLRPELFEVQDGKVELYRRMLPKALPGLYFAGLVQPIGPTIPLVEVQGQWLAAVLAGDVKLPSPNQMEREIQRHLQNISARYVGSARYTLEVDFREYAGQLRADINSGQAGF